MGDGSPQAGSGKCPRQPRASHRVVLGAEAVKDSQDHIKGTEDSMPHVNPMTTTGSENMGHLETKGGQRPSEGLPTCGGPRDPAPVHPVLLLWPRGCPWAGVHLLRSGGGSRPHLFQTPAQQQPPQCSPAEGTQKRGWPPGAWGGDTQHQRRTQPQETRGCKCESTCHPGSQEKPPTPGDGSSQYGSKGSGAPPATAARRQPKE